MLICEAERAFEDTRKSEIIIGHKVTLYKLKYKDHLFEFNHDQLMTPNAFNLRCLAYGLSPVDFGKKGWRAYISEIQKNAVIVDETDYEPFVNEAKGYCHGLLFNVSTDYSDDPELVERSWCYYKDIETIKNDLIICHLIIDFDLLQRILEKHGAKEPWSLGCDVDIMCKGSVDVWNFDKVKLKEFAGWDRD